MERLNEAEIATGMSAMHHYIKWQWELAVRLFDAGAIDDAQGTAVRIEQAAKVYDALLNMPFKMAF